MQVVQYGRTKKRPLAAGANYTVTANKILVSRETVVLRRWEIETEIDFIKRVDKGRNNHRERFGKFVLAFQIVYGGYSTFINSFDKIIYCNWTRTNGLKLKVENERFIFVCSRWHQNLKWL